MSAATTAEGNVSETGDPRRRGVSLKTRALAVIALLITAIVGGVDQIDLWHAHTGRLSRLRFCADLLASIEADALVRPMSTQHDGQIAALLQSLESDPDFLGAELTDADGTPIATQGSLADTANFVETRRGIVRVENGRPELLGRLTLRLSTANATAAFRRAIVLDLAELGLVLAAMIGAVYAALHFIMAPLARITAAMTRIAGGDANQEIPGTSRNDEVGNIARAVAVFKANLAEMQRLTLEHQRLQSQVEISQLRRRFTQALDSSAQAIVLFDADDRIIACNTPYLDLNKSADGIRPDMEAIVGHTYRETLERRIKGGVYLLPDGAEAYVADRLARRRKGSDDRTFQLANGRWMHVVERKTLDGDVVQVWSDVTIIKEGEAHQRELEKQLHHAQKVEALGTLAGGFAHDLNNTLVPILALAKLTMRRLPEDSRERANLATILHASEHARDLVRQILTYSRKEDATRQVVDLASLVHDSLKILRASLPSTIRLEEDLTAVPSVLADPGQVNQIVVNLVVNAAQAIGSAMGTIAVTLHAAAREARDGDAGGSATPLVRLGVRDTGCGMDERTKARIFEPFFTTRAVHEGTGLGLSIVHGIIAAHGGTIGVTSAPGKGTCFTIELPAMAPEAAPQAQSSSGALAQRVS